MPARKKRRLKHRLSDHVIDTLRHEIEAGDAWREFPRDAGSLIFVLVRGQDFFHQYTEDQLAEVWGDVGEEITAAHIRHKPGTRPWGWWKFDAPGPRRRLGGTGEMTGPLAFGRPWQTAGIDPYDEPTYEGEADYLERLNLLTDGERV